MAKSPLKIINKEDSHVRIDCPCGKYVHDLQAGDDGKVEYNYFIVAGSEGVPGVPKTGTDALPAGKKREGFVLFPKREKPAAPRDDEAADDDEEGSAV